MSYIIVTRNPRSKQLVVILNGNIDDNDAIPEEFETMVDAEKTASDIPMCRAWGFEILRITMEAQK